MERIVAAAGEIQRIPAAGADRHDRSRPGKISFLDALIVNPQSP